MKLIVIDPPTEEPITLDEAKLQCRVDIDDDDALIGALITAAREYCEAMDWRAYLTQTLQLWLNAWPAADFIHLPRPPLQTVSSVKYYGTDDTEYTFDDAYYFIDTIGQPGKIALNYNASWPGTSLRPHNAIVIEYVAGYESTGGYEIVNSVPQRIKQAILLLVGHWYENREATISGAISREIDFSVRNLIGINRAFRF